MKLIKSGKKLVHVIWRDSNMHVGWKDTGEALRLKDSDIRCESAGILLGIEEDRLMIALSGTFEGDSAGDILHIPLECVVQIRSLSMGKSIQIRRSK